MDITRDSVYAIESKRDINCVKLSYRVYNRLSDKQKEQFWLLFNKLPESGPCGDDNRIRPIRWYIADLALYIYSKDKKSLKKSFRQAKKYYKELWDQLYQLERELSYFSIPNSRERFIAKQFLFHGFIPIADYKDISLVNENKASIAYITSSHSIEGITYIFPKKLYMSARPGKSPDNRFLWYHFEGGAIIGGHTRAWYTNEIKSLKKVQDAQRNSN